MLQQTRVATVIPYYERWMVAFPTVESLAKARLDKVLQRWAGLGYYSRARNLHRAAQSIVTRYGGRVPREVHALQELPGIGRYTAGAVASAAFDQPAPILDGNVIRVLSRLFLIEDDTSKNAVRQRLWTIAEEIIPKRHARDFNQSLMELGALVCLPDSPRCCSCPVHRVCRARIQGKASGLPILRKRKPARSIQQCAVIVRRGGSYLLERRNEGELMAGLWTFPRFESRRQVQTRFPGLQTRPIGQITHSVMDQRITVKAFMVDTNTIGEPASTARWVSHRQLRSLALPAADRRLAALLL